MSHDKTKKLALALAVRSGTLAHPKGDGRVEIPRNLVRLMGWKDKQNILIMRDDILGLVLRAYACVGEDCIGRITISMDRVRIPLSMLRMAGIAGYKTIIISASLIPSSLSVQSYIIDKQDELQQIIEDAGPEIRDRLYAILIESRVQQPELIPRLVRGGSPLCNIVSEKATKLESVVTSTDHTTTLDGAQLFFPEFDTPTIIRIMGSPFTFLSHWVDACAGGALVLHRPSECPYCNSRAPDRMYLIPVIRKKNNELVVGYLLTKVELRDKIGRAFAGANPILFDLILYYKPFVDGLFDVYRNPMEPMSEDIVERAQAVCGDPNTFLLDTFPDPEGFSISSKMPLLLTVGCFTDCTKPHNIGK
jgi:hypothetical protein